MISKGEAIQRLKKMGVTVADDQSIITIFLPANVSLSVGIKDIKEKLKSIDYNASFCIKQSNGAYDSENMDRPADWEKAGEIEQEASIVVEESITEEDLKGSLLTMDDDGQFSLEGFGMGF